MHKLTMTVAAAATAAALASPALAETIYVYPDPGYVAPRPQVIYTPPTPYERVYVDRPYNAYDSYYVWNPTTGSYEPRYRYRDVDGTGRSYPVTPAEASRLYGYPYGYDGNPGYLVPDRNGVAVAPARGLTRDSNPDDYSSGHYNPKR